MTPPSFASLPFGSDTRPPLVHALSWARAGASGSRCQDRLALPRAADAGGRDRGLVRHLRCGPEGRRVPGHVGPDCGRLHCGLPQAAQHGCGAAGDPSGPHPRRLAGPAQEAGRTSPRGWQDQPKRLAGPAQEAGRTSPRGWQDQPKRLAQKDRDARWTLKRARTKATTETTRKRRVEIAIPVLGYKNHISIDRAYGFVRRFAVTNAAAYDGAQLGAVLDKSNTASPVWADTAYRSKANEALLEKNGFVSKVHFRRRPGFGLTPVQRRANRARSRVRSAIETVFAAQKRRFGLIVRTIGIARATTKIGLANLTYNMRRLIWWETRIHPA